MGLVSVDDRGEVRHLVLNRPEKRNAFNLELVRALGEALHEAAADASVRVVVLRGEGPVFSAGVDLGQLNDFAGGVEMLRPFRNEWLAACAAAEQMAKPVVASIHGACLGGALETALACDLRVVTDDAKLGLPETRLGLIPDVGGCSRLPAVVGVGRAKEMILTGRTISGSEAERIGLANRAVPAGELEAATDELVSELLEARAVPVGLAKGVIDAAAKPALTATLEFEVAAQQACVTSDEFRALAQAAMASST